MAILFLLSFTMINCLKPPISLLLLFHYVRIIGWSSVHKSFCSTNCVPETSSSSGDLLLQLLSSFFPFFQGSSAGATCKSLQKGRPGAGGVAERPWLGVSFQGDVGGEGQGRLLCHKNVCKYSEWRAEQMGACVCS